MSSARTLCALLLCALATPSSACKGVTDTSADAAATPAAAEPAAGAGERPTAARPKPAPAAGRWESAGALPFGLSSPSATLLADGRVLVYGDAHERRGLIYDPAGAGSWTPTEPARFPRPDHGATLLPNGRVLVTGGINVEKQYYVLRTTELFDPKSGTWTQGEHLPTRRRGHTQTLLSDGRVLVTGGDPGGFAPPIRRVDLFEPASGAWQGVGALVVGRYDHAAVRLSNDRVLVVGGLGKEEALASAEICTLDTTRCRQLTIQGARSRAGVVALGSGDVLIVGGVAKRSSAPTELLFDAGKTRFLPAPKVDEARLGGHSTTALKDGRVLVAGGDKDALSAAELFDPQAQAWATAPALPAGRTGHAAVRLQDGSVLLVGGLDAQKNPMTETHVWRPAE